jgi:putative transposase
LYVRTADKTSMRRACNLVQANRSMVYYRSCKRDPAALRIRLKDLAAVRVRYGYRRLYVLLRREGWKVNHKLVYRLYREEGLEVRTKKRRKRISALRVVLPAATTLRERWSMDFVADALYDGRRFRALTLVDNFTRESPAIEVGSSISGKQVVSVLERLARTHGLPQVITTDNGTEFTSRAVDEWAHQNGVKLDFIRPGKPVENAYIESFNGKLREECLNLHWFKTIEEAKEKIESWRVDYNVQRPHSALNDQTPSEFAENFDLSRAVKKAGF